MDPIRPHGPTVLLPAQEWVAWDAGGLFGCFDLAGTRILQLPPDP